MSTADKGGKKSRYQELSIIAVSGALYAVVGASSFFGINFYGVKFWPAVIIPATIAILYGGKIGALSASLGIFMADLATHGIALLSLTVGVPSNFVCFYLIGRFCQKFSIKKYILISSIALALGSMIIGIGMLFWSQLFPLPYKSNVKPMVLLEGLALALWTFVSEAPFLYIIVPPLAKAIKGRIPKVT
ncbi:MAG: hypothetical protein ACUVQ8_01915 [Nitrososphaeria archaeon]